MKTKMFGATTIMFCIIIAQHNSLHGATCSRASCSYTLGGSLPNCISTESVCISNGTGSVLGPKLSCTKCEDGYILYATSNMADDARCSSTAGYDSMNINACKKNTSCDNCETTAWNYPLSGYRVRSVAECVNYNCVRTTQFSCTAGYYGSPTTVGNGCTRCPASNGVYGTSADGSTQITNCYMLSGTSFSDSTGIGTHTGNCYYIN